MPTFFAASRTISLIRSPRTFDFDLTKLEVRCYSGLLILALERRHPLNNAESAGEGAPRQLNDC